MIERQQLLILREIAAQGSLTKAAGRLALSQSALSHSIRKFEEQAGVRLFEREGRGLRWTQAGQYLLQLAERILPELDDGDRVLAEFATGRRGALRAGMECHPCQQWLMRVVPSYLERWPDVDFELKTAFRFGGIGALLGHEIDALITPDPLDLPAIHYRRIFDYELVLVVAEGHRIRAVATPADLLFETLLTYPVARERLDIYTRFLVPGRALPRRHRTVETTEMMLRLVAAGRGVSVVPDWIMREEGRGLAIRAVRLGDGLLKGLHIGVRRGEEKIDYLRGFLDLACAKAREGQGAP